MDELLGRYRRGTLAAGVAAPEQAALGERYQAHLTYAFESMVVTWTVGGLIADEAIARLVRRTVVAVEDLDAIADVG